jgi:hypothetical protein
LLPLEKNKIENRARDRTTPPYIDYNAQDWASTNVSVAASENLLINIRPLSRKEIARDHINNNATRRISKGDGHCNLKVSSKRKGLFGFSFCLCFLLSLKVK